jgi:hypothetical protein
LNFLNDIPGYVVLSLLNHNNGKGSLITNDARCTLEIISRIATIKAAFKKRKFFSPANWI